MSEFVKIGHRGAAGYEPENTMRSFIKAIRLGADAIEFDVRLSADKKVMVIHDAAIDRTTNRKGLVSWFTCQELRRLDAGKGEKILALENVFGILSKANPWGWKPCFNVELKGRGMVEDVLKLIRQYNLVNSVVVSAFDETANEPYDAPTWKDLFAIKRMEPDLRIALIAKSQETFGIALDLAADTGRIYAINPSKKIVTQKMVAAAHAKNIKIFVWTVNKPSEIARIKAMGADGIFSDYPDRL